LNVEIDDQGFFALGRADGGQIARDGGFAHPPFLIEYHPAHGLYLWSENEGQYKQNPDSRFSGMQEQRVIDRIVETCDMDSCD
jgi:hypothetical protein